MRFSRAQAAQLILGSGAGGPMIVIGVAPIPAELVAYYAAGTPVTATAPETIVGLTIYYDGQTPQNYLYDGMVVDSSAPKKTSRVTGANVAGTVNEMMRQVLNPGAVLGGGRFIQYTEEMNTILTSSDLATTLLAAQKPADAFHRWSVNTRGTQGWGDGASLADVYMARNSTDTGLEIGQSVRLRGFGSVLNDAIIVKVDGETDERLFVQFDGYHGWGNGTNPWDTDLYRAGAGILETGVRFRVGGSHKDVAASCNGINNASGSSTTTTSSYGNLPATSSFSFVKQFTATQIKIELHCTSYTTVANSVTRFGVSINGTDYDVAQILFNPTSTHLQASGVAYVASGLTAGTYTIQGRWKRVSGTGTSTVDTGDWLSISAMEVSA